VADHRVRANRVCRDRVRVCKDHRDRAASSPAKIWVDKVKADKMGKVVKVKAVSLRFRVADHRDPAVRDRVCRDRVRECREDRAGKDNRLCVPTVQHPIHPTRTWPIISIVPAKTAC